MKTRQRNGTGSITKRTGRPGSPYQGRVYVNGRRVSVYGKTKAEVQAKIDVEKRRSKDGLRQTDARLTLATYVERWLGRDRDVRERTVARYRTLLVGHVLTVIGARKLSELQPDDVRRVLDRMKLAGLSTTTRSHVRAALRLALGDAVRDGLVARNVAGREFVKLPAPKPRRVRALSDAEMRAILAAVRGDRLGPLFEFIIATGSRLGEATGLRWQDVHWDLGEIEFVQTLGRVGGRDLFGDPKNEASRGTFPITAGVRSALVAQKARQDSGLTGAPPRLLVENGVARGPLVFTATDGGPLSGSYVTHHFQKLLAAAGIEPLRVHDLRHLFVSYLFAQGVPLELISGLVRHASPAVTRSVYLHLRGDKKAEAAAGLDRLWATGS